MRYGRIGIEFSTNWQPSIFVGVVLNNSDHKLRNFDSPQLVVIIDCDPKKSEEIKSEIWLKKIYDSKLNHSEGFEIDTTPKNKWRLLILQKPLTEVLKHERYEEQKKEIKAELLKGIKWILQYYNEMQNSN